VEGRIGITNGNLAISGIYGMPCIHLLIWNLTGTRVQSLKTIYLQHLTEGRAGLYSQFITTLPLIIIAITFE
jgi:hypothetical protein